MCRTFLVFLLAGAAGCATTQHYVYQPAEHGGALASGYPAASYAIPQERPMGDVRVASFGVTGIVPEGDRQPIRVLHARMIISNANDPTTWLLDTRTVLAAIPGEGQSRPVVVNAEGATLPIVEIRPGEKRGIDFYYPLPQSLANATSVSAFDLLWQVQTGTRAVAMRTPFERVRVQPDYARANLSYEIGLGWGPYWWWDPFYPRYVFVHPGPVAFRPLPQNFSRRVTIANPPTRRVR